MKEIVTPEDMENAVFTDEKQKREENIREITDKLAAIDYHYDEERNQFV